MLPSEIRLRTLAVRSEPPPTAAADNGTAEAVEATPAPAVEASAASTTEPVAMQVGTAALAPAAAPEAAAPAARWQHAQDSPVDYADVIEFFSKPSVRQTKPGMYFDAELVRAAARATEATVGRRLLTGGHSCAAAARGRFPGTAPVAPADQRRHDHGPFAGAVLHDVRRAARGHAHDDGPVLLSAGAHVQRVQEVPGTGAATHTTDCAVAQTTEWAAAPWARCCGQCGRPPRRSGWSATTASFASRRAWNCRGRRTTGAWINGSADRPTC